MTPAEMAEIHRASFEVPRPWSAEEFTGLLGENGVFVVAEADGFALGRLAGPEAELLTLAVRPEARRAGVGGRLMARFLEACQGGGAEEVFLEVADGNTAAIALYRRVGFVEAGVRKDYYSGAAGAKVTALVLRRLV